MKRLFFILFLCTMSLWAMEQQLPQGANTKQSPASQTPIAARKGPLSLMQLAATKAIVDHIEDYDPSGTKTLFIDYHLDDFPLPLQEKLKNQIIKKYPSYWMGPASLKQKFEGPQNSKSYFNYTGDKVLSCVGNTATLLDPNNKKELVKFTHDKRITSAEFSPDNSRVIINAGDYDYLQATDSGNVITKFFDVESRFSADGSKIIFAENQGSRKQSYQIYDAHTGTLLREHVYEKIPKVNFTILDAQFNANDTRITTLAWQAPSKSKSSMTREDFNETHFYKITIRDSNSDEELFTTRLEGTSPFNGGKIPVIELDASGTKLLVIRTIGEFIYSHLVDLKTRKELFDLRAIASGHFNHRGDLIIGVTLNGYIELWDTQAGKKIATLHAPTKWKVRDAQFSPDGSKIIATAGPNAYVWELPTTFISKLSLQEVIVLLKMKQFGKEVINDVYFKQHWNNIINSPNLTKEERKVIEEMFLPKSIGESLYNKLFGK